MRVNEPDHLLQDNFAASFDIQAGLERTTSLRTFWSLVFVDGYSTATIGAPSRLPWDISQTPSYLSTVPTESVDTPALVFEYHLRLLQLQEEHINLIYQKDFPSLSQPAKDALFIRAYNALTSLRQEMDPRLLISRTTQPHKTQLVFWISYHTAEISLHRRFLDPTGVSARHAPALRAITAAANSTTRLLRALDAIDALHTAPPFIIYHVMRASLVHGINMTAEDERIRRSAHVRYHVCLRTMRRLVAAWPRFTSIILDFMFKTSARWGLSIGNDEGADGASSEEESEDDDTLE